MSKAIFPSGASSSELAPRFDLLPPGVLTLELERWALGAAIHGPNNWRLGAADPEWRRDRANHLLAHALAYVAGDRSEDHLSAIRVNAAMLQYADRADTAGVATTPAEV